MDKVMSVSLYDSDVGTPLALRRIPLKRKEMPEIGL